MQRFRATPPRRPVAKQQRFAERAENAVARALLAEALEADFLDIMEAFAGSIDPGGLEAAILGGAVGAGEASAPFPILEGRLTTTMTERFEEAIERGAQIGLRFAPPNVAVSTEVVTDTARLWLQREAAESVALIADTTRRGLRQALVLALDEQITTTEASRRIGQMVGLTPRQATALANRRAQLERQLIPVPDARTPQVERTIEDELARFRERLLRQRGRNIADTEMQRAIQQGERAFWETAAAEGQVEREGVTKRWNTVLDERVCPICAPLHGQIARFDVEFQTSVGPLQGPPAHARCRCFLDYVVEELMAA